MFDGKKVDVGKAGTLSSLVDLPPSSSANDKLIAVLGFIVARLEFAEANKQWDNKVSNFPDHPQALSNRDAIAWEVTDYFTTRIREHITSDVNTTR